MDIEEIKAHIRHDINDKERKKLLKWFIEWYGELGV